MILLLIALFTVTSAAIAMTLRNLIHSALLLIASWTGIAAFYLWAGAEFVGFAQVLVYVGAVSMVVLFAVLLTRHSRDDLKLAPESWTRISGGMLAAGLTLCVLAAAVLSSGQLFEPGAAGAATERSATVTVRQIGSALLSEHPAALLAIGVILTVALLGATVIAAGAGRAPGQGAPNGTR